MQRIRAIVALGLAGILVVLEPGLGGPLLAAGDRTAPVVGAPVAAPAAGETVRAVAIPLRVSWSASDAGGSGVARVTLQVRVDGGSWSRVALPSPTARHVLVTVRPPHDAQFRARATDAAGNTSAWAYGLTRRWTLRSEASPSIAGTGAWSTVIAAGYVGRRALRSRQPGARLVATIHGSQVAWIGRMAPTGGSARVYVDGVYRATVSSHRTTGAYRRILYSASWPEPGDHTLAIQVSGTPGHPDVVVDGLVVGAAPPPDPVLVGAGDIATCDGRADSRTARLLDAIPGRVFAAGDTAYPDGTAAQLRECYGPTWGRWRLRTSPAVGNHDYDTRDAAPYWDYFGMRAGGRGKGWYAYDLGTWRVYALNANCREVGCGPGSVQVAWLRADLAGHPRACVAVVMHQPLFSSGRHGGDQAVRPLWATLHDAGADVVLAAHDHDYERFAPQTPAGVADPAGMRQFVVGTGGAPLRPFATVRANSEVRSATTHGVLKLTLRPGSYAWQFVPVAGGSFRDAGSDVCH